MKSTVIASLVAGVNNKRAAVRMVREEANAIIEQGERRAKGWDRGMYRDDDTLRRETIRQRTEFSVSIAFALALKFSN